MYKNELTKSVSARKSIYTLHHRTKRMLIGNLALTDYNTITKSKTDTIRERYIRANINKKHLCLFCWDEKNGKRIITTDEQGHPFSLLNDLMTTAKRMKWAYEYNREKCYLAAFATDEENQHNGINGDEVFAYHITNISDERRDYYNESTIAEDIAEIVYLSLSLSNGDGRFLAA